MIRMFIKVEEIQSILSKVSDAIRYFHYHGLNDNDINISMPAHFINLLHYYSSRSGFIYDNIIPLSVSEPQFWLERYKNINIKPHFRNEVAVFAVNFYFSPAIEEAVVIPLPDFKNSYR